MKNKTSNKFYITTPIYYANGSPHIGHFLTTTIADVLARYNRKLLGDENVFFTTGLDCHGTTVEQGAQKAGYDLDNIGKYIEKRVIEWKKSFDDTDISYNFFVDTTNPQHKKTAQEFIQKMVDNGDVYKDIYKGKYCNGCEKFLTRSDLNEEELCPLHRPDQVIETEEENYFFKLSAYSEKIRVLLEKNELKLVPEAKKHEMLARIDAGLEDLSLSRPKEKVSWGVEFPNDPDQVVYVWVEALINYISSLEINDKSQDFWQGVVHLVGKDINWFHNVIWPAFLLSAGYETHKISYVHSFLNVGGKKISKSLGNVITPDDLSQRYGIDGARYLILANLPHKDDADVTYELLDEKYNADLANGLGNLVARLTKLIEKNNLDIKPKPLSQSVWEQDWATPLSEFRLDLALVNIWKKIAAVDKHINENEPWAIENVDKLTEVLKFELDGLYEIAVILEPFMPNTSSSIKQTLEANTIIKGKNLFSRV